MSRRPPFGKGGFGVARKTKVLCPKAEDKKIPVVPPQFTACAASGIPIDPQSCIGLTRPGLLEFQPGRSERNSAPSFFLPCTHRQFSGKRELARTGFHQRVCLVKLQTSLPLLVFQVKNIWGFCLNIWAKIGIFIQKTGDPRWRISGMVFILHCCNDTWCRCSWGRDSCCRRCCGLPPFLTR